MLDLGGGAPAPARGNGAKTVPAGPAERGLTAANRLQFEKELLGFYVSGHPMNAYAGLAEAIEHRPGGPAARPARPQRVPPLRHRHRHHQEALAPGSPAVGGVHPRHQERCRCR